MKLEFPKVKVETSRTFESEAFSLGDTRVIMDLLSSKIYSRPKYIIVQEVSSNARDANREAGKADTPIIIKLPSRFDDNLIISDSGIGISPNRMSDVFLKYGNSTKRVDDKLTGGFGIGAKTPFTYTDTFNVVTTTLDNDGKHKRTYIAHKADDGIRMSLVTTEITDDPTGTSISFAVDKPDFHDFEHAVKEVCSRWTPRPDVQGNQNFHWNEEAEAYKGNGWSLTDGLPGARILIDSIPYRLRLDTIFKNTYSEEYQLMHTTGVRMYFDTGEIDVSATREDLDYKDRTVKTIQERIKLILGELYKEVSKAVVAATSLWDASLAWHKLTNQYKRYVKEPTWNNKRLMPKSICLPNSVLRDEVVGAPKGKNRDWLSTSSYIKITVFENTGSEIVTKKSGWRGKTIDRSINVANSTLIALDDSGKSRPNKLRIETLFDTNQIIREVAVVSFKDPLSEAVAKVALFWDELTHVVLSTIPKAKNPNNPNSTKTYTVNAVKVLENSSNGYTYKWKPEKSRSPEDTLGGTYIMIKNGKCVTSSGNVISKDAVKELQTHLEEDIIYGILYKYRNKISSSWCEVTEKAILKITTLRASQTVKNYIIHGGNSSNEFGDETVNRLRGRCGELSDDRFSSIFANGKLADSGENDYYRYSRLAHSCGLTPDKCLYGVRNESKTILADYCMLSRWHEMRTYHMTSLEVKQWTDELIFYLNAKYAAKIAAQGDDDAND